MDDEGFTVTVFDSILDHKTDGHALPMSKKFAVTRNGTRRIRKTTCGWHILVLWKDGTETWVPLKDMKESHPVEVTEYARVRGIDNHPAFAWWVPYTLHKRDVIISAVKSHIWKMTHKYGTEVLKSVNHAYELDQTNGDNFWKDAIANKEMHNVGIAFEVLPADAHAPVGWSKVTGHIIFDVKMSLERKARWVLDDH